MDDETAEQQADITRLLLHHIQAPLAGTLRLRGVLPAPAPAAAVRAVTGPADAWTSGRLTAYEIPLLTHDDDVLTGYDILGILRAVTTGTHIYSSYRVSGVMGMTLIHLDPASADASPLTGEDGALTILRTLAHPFVEEQPEPEPRLRGFLFLEQDRLRLYLDAQDAPGVIAADVRPSGAVTALLAALPSLIAEEERRTEDSTDPHCSCVVDLTHW